jgi:hypothetical protein
MQIVLFMIALFCFMINHVKDGADWRKLHGREKNFGFRIGAYGFHIPQSEVRNPQFFN